MTLGDLGDQVELHRYITGLWDEFKLVQSGSNKKRKRKCIDDIRIGDGVNLLMTEFKKFVKEFKGPKCKLERQIMKVRKLKNKS